MHAAGRDNQSHTQQQQQDQQQFLSFYENLQTPTAAGSQPFVQSSELSAAPVDSHPLALQNKFPSGTTTTTNSPSCSLSPPLPRGLLLPLSISQSPILKTPCSYSLPPFLTHTRNEPETPIHLVYVCLSLSLSFDRPKPHELAPVACVPLPAPLHNKNPQLENKLTCFLLD